MKAILTSLALVAGVLAQAPTYMINTPTNAVVCQPLLLSWVGGTPPYFLSILPGGQPSAAALVDLGQQMGTQVTWTVNQAVGTSLGLTIRDNNGVVAQSAPFTVNNGPDTSCVGHDPSSSAAAPGGSAPATTGGAPPATTSAAGATTPAATTSTPAPATSAASPPAASSKPATSAPASSASRSSAAASASASSTNAASANFAQIGTAGVVGAALAALLV